MAITVAPYANFMFYLAQGAIRFYDDTLSVALLTPAYVPDLELHNYFNSGIAECEVGGPNYTPGGNNFSIDGFVYDPVAKTYTLNATLDPFVSVTGIVRYAVIYKQTSAISGPHLFGLIDLGEDTVLNAEPLPLSFTNGVVQLTATTT